MSNYLPPIEDLPIFDTSVFQANNEPITFTQATKEFLRYPVAQGSETFNDPINKFSVVITPSQVSVNNNDNLPFGDPIYTQIYPNTIYMQNGNATNQTSTLRSDILNITNSDIGASIDITAGAATATNWNIDINGTPYFSALKEIAVYTQTGGDVEIDLLGLQNLTYSMDMTAKIATLTFVNGIINGNYKIYLTGVSGEIFYKTSCQNNLLGDTVVGVGSFWILTVHYTGNIYAVDCQNFT